MALKSKGCSHPDGSARRERRAGKVDFEEQEVAERREEE